MRIVGLTFSAAQAALEPVSEAATYRCPACGKEYKTRDGVEKHIQEKHPEEPRAYPGE